MFHRTAFFITPSLALRARSGRMAFAPLALLVALAAGGCQKTDTAGAGPAETAGKQIDKAAVEAGKELKQAAEKTGKVIENAGAKMQEKAKEAQAKDGDK